MTRETFQKHLRRSLKQHANQKEAARAWGVSPQYLSDVLRGHREPGPRLLEALGLRRVVEFR